MSMMVRPEDRPLMLFPHWTTGVPCEHCFGDGWETDQRVTGDSLVEHRRGLQLTATAVAKRMGISKSYLCDLERGTRAWSRTLVKAFYQACRELTVE